MPSYQIPPWIQPANPAEHFLAGMRQGASIGELQARQQQAQAELAAQQQMAQDRIQAEALRHQAELETQKAYHDAQQGLENQRIKDEQKRIEEMNRHNVATENNYKAKYESDDAAAALKMAAQRKFTQELQKNGGDVVKALISVPGFISATTIPLLRHDKAGLSGLTPTSAAAYYKQLSGEDTANATDEEKSLIKEEKQASRDIVRQGLGLPGLRQTPKLDLSVPAMPQPFGAATTAPSMGATYDLMPVGGSAMPVPSPAPASDSVPPLSPAPAIPVPAPRRAPSPKAISYLQANPESAPDFEAKFGVSAGDYLE